MVIETAAAQERLHPDRPASRPERRGIPQPEPVSGTVQQVSVLRDEWHGGRCVIVRADYSIQRRVAAKVIHDSGEGVRVDAYVRIQEQDNFTRGAADAGVAGISGTTLRVECEHGYPMALRNRNRVVVGPIVHHQAFPRGHGRFRYSLQTPIQHSRSIVNRDND
jgi:hypothetical protein